tara:strand:+ start:177 stop:560 length:384 start_codon:yes stop_codon:yes gene_type:complete
LFVFLEVPRISVFVPKKNKKRCFLLLTRVAMVAIYNESTEKEAIMALQNFMTPKFAFESFGVLPPENFLKESDPNTRYVWFFFEWLDEALDFAGVNESEDIRTVNVKMGTGETSEMKSIYAVGVSNA